MTSIIVDERNVIEQQFDKALTKANTVVYFCTCGVLVVFPFSGTEIEWRAFGLGVLGWVIALFLRGPLSAIVMKLPKEKATTIVVGSSGVFEECVRIAILMLTGMTYSWSVSIGQGWAAVEVLFVMLNVIVMASLASAFHIGCTMLAAKYPWLVVLIIPLHSFVNLTALKLAKKSIVQTELVIAAIGTIVLVVGISVLH
jgi:hypothetical protein